MADVVSVTGFILSSMPVGDYDRRVVILSRELGKIAAFAKGARRPNSHLIGVTRPFIFGTFEVYRGRDSYTIQKANVTNYFEELVSDLDGVLYGYYFAELAEYYGRENLDAADMINLLYVAFKALVNKSLPNELVRYIYEIRLIAVNGECPDFFSCAGCGSEKELQLCSYGANRMLYLLIVCIQNTFAFFAWAVMMWGILNLFKNKNVGIVAVIIINLIEMLLYRLIDVKSIYRFLRYYNIFEGNNIWFKNDNWGYNSFIMDSKESQYIISGIIIFAGCILLIYTYIKKHPCDSTGIIEKVVEKLMCRIRYIESKLPVFYFELKKVILYQKTIIVMVFIAIILLNINYGTRLKYDIKNSAMYSFCEEHKMDSTDELKNCKEQLKIENTDTDSSDFNKKFNEELTQEKINYLQYIIDKKENGFNVSTVSQYKYESPFFKRQFFNQEIIALLLTVLGLYLNAGLISFEKKNNMIMNIRACKERKRWLIKKAVINCVILSGIACLVYICYYNKLFNIYEINDLSVGIHSIQAFSDYPFNVSILGVVVLDILYKIVLINSVAVFSYVTTGLFSYQVSFLVSLIVLIPSILDLIGVKLFSYLSVIKLISFFYYWKASYAVVMFGGVLTLMIIAIMVIVYVLGGEYGINSK